MFRNLPVYSHDPQTLVALGKAMIQSVEDDKPLDQPEPEDENTSTLDDGQLRLPAGYTYFGQFVDHDITFDPVSSLVRQNDPNALEDFRTPRFDLDSLYGRGPADQPYMYDDSDEPHLRTGETLGGDGHIAGPDLPRIPAADDQPRNARAIIGDPRNDENMLVSALQATFIDFHNRVLDKLKTDQGLSGDDLFKAAQKTVRWHYQWIVLRDFLPRLVGPAVVEDILRAEDVAAPGKPGSVLRGRRRFYEWHEQPFIPVEFSVAAYRFGHSMARPSYVINDVIPLPLEGVSNAVRIPLFSADTAPKRNLNGFQRLPAQWGVQWKYLLPGIKDPSTTNNEHLPQPSYKIDTHLSNPLGALPAVTAEDLPGTSSQEDAKNLATRNLLRGHQMGLPSGQAVAKAMGIEPLSDDDLFNGVDVNEDVKTALSGNAPLWFYVLKEADLLGEGGLGPIGGRIVAEVLTGLACGDPLSFINVEPGWTPTLPAADAGTFTLSDLVNFARPLAGDAPPSPPAPGKSW